MFRFLTLALGALLLFATGSIWLALYPPILSDTGGIEAVRPAPRSVSIAVGSRESVHVTVEPGRARAVVVLLHGYGRDERRLRRHARYLVRDGYAVVSVRFRSSGGWGRRPTTLGAHELADVRAVLEWIGRQSEWTGRPIALFGESLGASVAIVAAASHPEVSSVVADDAFARSDWAIEDRLKLEYHLPAWPLTPLARAIGRRVTGLDPGGLDVSAALAGITDRPVLLIHGGLEDHLRHRHARSLEAAAGPVAESWTVAGAGHAASWETDRENYERRVRVFLSTSLTGQPLYLIERDAARGRTP